MLATVVSQSALAELYVTAKMFKDTSWDQNKPSFIVTNGIYYKYDFSDSSYYPKTRIAIQWNDTDNVLMIEDYRSSEPAKTYKVLSADENSALIVNTERSPKLNGNTKGHSSMVMYPVASNKIGFISMNLGLFENARRYALTSSGKYETFISFLTKSDGGAITMEQLAYSEKLTTNELKHSVQEQFKDFTRMSDLSESEKKYSVQGYLRLNDAYAAMYKDWQANNDTFRSDIDKRLSWQKKRYPVLKDYSPLVIAAHASDLTKVNALIDEGYNVNASFKNWTPLLQAAQDGELEIVRALLDAGADIEQRTQESTPLFSALKELNTDVIKLLIERGADMNVRDYKTLQTPIGRTVAYSQFTLTELLLKAGADPCVLDRYGSTTVSRLPGEYTKKWKAILPKCY
jgi:hypothetical protein